MQFSAVTLALAFGSANAFMGQPLNTRSARSAAVKMTTQVSLARVSRSPASRAAPQRAAEGCVMRVRFLVRLSSIFLVLAREISVHFFWWRALLFCAALKERMRELTNTTLI